MPSTFSRVFSAVVVTVVASGVASGRPTGGGGAAISDEPNVFPVKDEYLLRWQL